MIVGTAGHIDHGKTTLVRALTGVDTDRLPEEKKRGISIELGYAYLDVPGSDRRIAFIDVPGHERLVHTMLAGATGIDYALLLVAADDGVMPQTREHLAVLSLLGLSRGAVVLTKIDRVDAGRLTDVKAQVQALVQASALRDAPLLAVSAQTGDGLAALKDLLFDAARNGDIAEQEGQGFRLAVDRAFTLAGVGTVATGTAHAGSVRVGDELVLQPGPAGQRRVRVRGLHAQNAAVATARAGQRVALALAGVAKEEVLRGMWLCTPEVALSSDRIDARLSLWHGEARSLRSGASVHVHLGASDVMGSVAVLDEGDALTPGATARVQLVLREPIGAWRGERIVLRDASASRTLAGGIVLDPEAPKRYRRTAQRLAALAAWEAEEPAERLRALLDAAPGGVDLAAWSRAEGRVATALPVLPAGMLRGGDAGADWALASVHTEALRTAVLEALAAFHRQQPDELGPDAARLRRLAAPRLAEPLWRALLATLQREGALVQHGAQLHLPEHGVQLSAQEQRIAQKVLPRLEAGGFDPPWVRDLAADTRESEALLRAVLARLARRGELHQVVKDLYYPARTMQRLAQLARERAGPDGELSAASFRDATQLGRKRAIQILEFFDRVGLLRRVHDEHRLRSDCSLFADRELQ